LPRLALNQDPSNLRLPFVWYYRHEPVTLGWISLKKKINIEAMVLGH
jgi:hypothetical protein